MIGTLESKALVDGLSAVASIGGIVKLTPTERGLLLSVTGSHGSIHATRMVEGQMEGEGEHFYLFGPLRQYVAQLHRRQPGEIKIEANEDGISLELEGATLMVPAVMRSAYYEFKPREIEPLIEFSATGDLFENVLRHLPGFCADVEQKASASGLLFSQVDGRIHICATDTYSGIMVVGSQQSLPDVADLIVPANFMMVAKRIFPGGATLKIGKNRVEASTAEGSISWPLVEIDGVPPSLVQILGRALTAADCRAIFNAEGLVRDMGLMNLVNEDGVTISKCEMVGVAGDTEISMRNYFATSDVDDGSEASVIMEAEEAIVGDLDVILDPKRLLDLARAIPGDTVHFNWGGGVNLVTVTGDDHPDFQVLGLLMPIRKSR